MFDDMNTNPEFFCDGDRLCVDRPTIAKTDKIRHAPVGEKISDRTWPLCIASAEGDTPCPAPEQMVPGAEEDAQHVGPSAPKRPGQMKEEPGRRPLQEKNRRRATTEIVRTVRHNQTVNE
ncbi:MAG: hypothetical protein AAF183_13415 [Pseudomonadota bacterium]